MDPAGGRPDRARDVFEKRYDVVIGAFFDLRDLRNRKPRSLANFGCVFLRDLAELGHRLAGEQFDFQPDLEFAFVRPDLAHLRPGITINHCRKIKRLAKWESVLCTKNKIAPASYHRSDFEKSIVDPSLANLGAEEPPVALDAYFAAA
jgi:hypothetical protein